MKPRSCQAENSRCGEDKSEGRAWASAHQGEAVPLRDQVQRVWSNLSLPGPHVEGS